HKKNGRGECACTHRGRLKHKGRGRSFPRPNRTMLAGSHHPVERSSEQAATSPDARKRSIGLLFWMMLLVIPTAKLLKAVALAIYNTRSLPWALEDVNGRSYYDRNS
ncbi:MAG TPA: hypothetical protein VFX76_22330, partial [Roseiflexaceae bacterium]|nr:hypothetical protein [Roseiflexaceae bacterium]